MFSSRMEMLKFPQPSGADFSIIKDLCPLRAPVCHIRPWGWCHRNSPSWSLTCKKPISLLFSKCVCVCSVSRVWLFETFGFPGSSDGKVSAAMWETWVDPWATVHGIAKSWTWLSNFTGSLDCSPPTKLLCPWNFSAKNTGVGCYFLLQGIFLTQGWNLYLLYLLAGRFFTTAPPGKPSF